MGASFQEWSVIVMEKRLETALQEGEQVRWSGRPVRFRLMQSAYRSGMVLTWLMSVCVILLVAYFLAPYYLTHTLTGDLLLAAAVVLFLTAQLSLRPLLDKRTLENETVYAVTDRRVIAVVKDEVMSLPLEGLTAAVKEWDGTCASLYFGKAAEVPEYKSRVYALSGVREYTDELDGLIFYHVDELKDLVCCLPQVRMADASVPGRISPAV